MSRLIRFVKRYPLSLLCVAAIWYLCLLFNAPRTRLNDVPLIDKWVHVAMYLGTCSLIWFEYLRAHRRPQWRRLLTWAVVAPAAMSGLIEWLQANATATLTLPATVAGERTRQLDAGTYTFELPLLQPAAPAE